ncbi:MAG: spermidine synthase [Nocardioides sp.]
MLRVEIVPADRPGAYLVRLDGMDQSLVDLADPRRLAFEYVRRIGDVIDASGPAGEPIRILHVGGAALTLPRYVAATRPRSSQIVLEPDGELVERVRAELPLPQRSGVKIRVADGRAGIAGVRDGAVDLVVVDAFAEGRMPADLTSSPFWQEVDRVLAPGGRLIANLVDRAPFRHARRVLAGIREHLPELVVTAEPATLRGRRQGNLVVVAGRTPADGIEAALEAAAARSGAPYRVLGAAATSDTLGGGTPFSDADAMPGPAPERAR